MPLVARPIGKDGHLWTKLEKVMVAANGKQRKKVRQAGSYELVRIDFINFSIKTEETSGGPFRAGHPEIKNLLIRSNLW